MTWPSFLSPDFYSKVTSRRYMLFTEYLVCAEHCSQPLPRVVYPEVTVCCGCRYCSSITYGAAQAWSEKRTAPESPQLGHRPWQPALFHSGFPSIPFSPEPLLTHVHWKMSLPSSARSWQEMAWFRVRGTCPQGHRLLQLKVPRGSSHPQQPPG